MSTRSEGNKVILFDMKLDRNFKIPSGDHSQPDQDMI